MRDPLLLLCSLLALAGGVATGGQAPRRTDGVIVGTAIDSSTGLPVGGALAVLRAEPLDLGGAQHAVWPGIPPQRVVTTPDGKFVFRSLAAGNYSIEVSRHGYLAGRYGSVFPNAKAHVVHLGESEARGGLVVTLWRPGTINGVIKDERGARLDGVEVHVLRRTIRSGQVRYVMVPGSFMSDDQGNYSATSLFPGEYIVVVAITQRTIPRDLTRVLNGALAGGRPPTDALQQLTRSGAHLVFPVAGRIIGDVIWQTTSLDLPAAASDLRWMVYPTTYFPGVLSAAQASSVRLTTGEVRDGVDFALHSLAASEVAGELVGGLGAEPHTQIELHHESSLDLGADSIPAGTAVTDSAGKFRFAGIVPGSYRLRVRRWSEVAASALSSRPVTGDGTATERLGQFLEPLAWAETGLQLAGHASGIRMEMQTPARIRARLQLRGRPVLPSGVKWSDFSMFILPEFAESNLADRLTITRSVTGVEGELLSRPLMPGPYLVQAFAPAPWSLSAVIVHGRDVLDRAFVLEHAGETDMTLVFEEGGQTAQIAGDVVRPAHGGSDYIVLVFPADPRMWTGYGPAPRRLNAIPVGTDRQFRVTGLPAGEYALVALAADDLPELWQDPEFLRRALGAATVRSVRSAGVTTVSLGPWAPPR